MSFGDVYASTRLEEMLRDRILTNLLLDKISGEKESSFSWDIPTDGCTEKFFVNIVNKVRQALFSTGEFKLVHGWVDYRNTEVTFRINTIRK